MKNKKNKIILLLALILILIVIVIICIFLQTNKKSNNKEHKDKIESSINASKIWNKYDKDPNKYEPTYDGDYVEATGIITYIGEDDHGTPSMEIADKKNGQSYVLAVFNTYDEMSKVKVGEKVSVSGYFHIMSSKNKVVIKRSKILKIYN